jgi:hypothetical protein
MEMIAEGVETVEQLARLKGLKCECSCSPSRWMPKWLAR